VAQTWSGAEECISSLGCQPLEACMLRTPDFVTRSRGSIAGRPSMLAPRWCAVSRPARSEVVDAGVGAGAGVVGAGSGGGGSVLSAAVLGSTLVRGGNEPDDDNACAVQYVWMHSFLVSRLMLAHATPAFCFACPESSRICW
jgi:hypothetical protein